MACSSTPQEPPDSKIGVDIGIRGLSGFSGFVGGFWV